MFHSHLQYSLLNWGRSSKNYLQQLKILQNKVLRAILFRPKQFPTTLFHSNLNILKLDDMTNMEFAKFMFKFNNKMLPESFDCYFTKLDNIRKHNTTQKHRNQYYQFVKIIKLLCLPVVFRNAISIVLVLIRMTVKLEQQLNLFIIDVL